MKKINKNAKQFYKNPTKNSPNQKRKMHVNAPSVFCMAATNEAAAFL